MATKIKTNKASRTLTFTKSLAGVTQHVTAAIVLGGASTTAAALSAIFQAAIQAQSDLDAASTTVNAKLQARKATLTAALAAEALLHRWAEATFGPASTVLEDFGFTPEKVVEKSAAVKAAGAAKSTATRKAKEAAVASALSPTAKPEPTPAVVAVKA